MDYLDEHGYHPITLTDFRAYLNGSRPLPDRPVVLTFDDGYADLYTQAFPVLKHHHFKAVAYIVSGFVGRVGRERVAGPGARDGRLRNRDRSPHRQPRRPDQGGRQPRQ